MTKVRNICYYTKHFVSIYLKRMKEITVFVDVFRLGKPTLYYCIKDRNTPVDLSNHSNSSVCTVLTERV